MTYIYLIRTCIWRECNRSTVYKQCADSPLPEQPFWIADSCPRCNGAVAWRLLSEEAWKDFRKKFKRFRYSKFCPATSGTLDFPP